MSEQHKCCERIWDNFYNQACGKNAKVKRDGMYYCGIHDPVRRAEKQQAKREKWSAELQARQNQWAKEKADAEEQKRRADCFPDLLEALQGVVAFLDRLNFDGSDINELHTAARAAIRKATE